MTRARAVLAGYLTALGDAPAAFCTGVVSAVDPGAAADGNPLVTVNWMGQDIYATYGDHYTPVVGDVVLMAQTQPRAILIRLIGTPPA